MEAILSPFTIWEFRGVTIPQTKIVVRHTEPMEIDHEYQRVLGRVYAYNKEGALEKFKGLSQ